MRSNSHRFIIRERSLLELFSLRYSSSWCERHSGAESYTNIFRTKENCHQFVERNIYRIMYSGTRARVRLYSINDNYSIPRPCIISSRSSRFIQRYFQQINKSIIFHLTSSKISHEFYYLLLLLLLPRNEQRFHPPISIHLIKRERRSIATSFLAR